MTERGVMKSSSEGRWVLSPEDDFFGGCWYSCGIPEALFPSIFTAFYERPPWPCGADWAPRPRGE